MDIVEAHEQYRVLRPPAGSKAPRAVQTPFGWCVIGPLYGLHNTPDKIHVCRISLSSQDDNLAELVKTQWSIESLGIRKVASEISSVEDKRAMEILQTTTRKINGRYECGMLWKGEIKNLPDTLPLARAGFARFESRFRWNIDFAQTYNNVIDEYLRLGHAASVPTKETGHNSWFLPHHAVENPKQPGKLRIVFDACALG
ncbi:hypothetical protein M514_11732 [Trichuris suis]|uniref:Uncharacterized protein n=1 Tax=Trichuris suis TaxID=68888 RepID=A0A085LQX3_9BILA|nr:hypothetical protein M513_11732 [Trichuris suis]KFD61396.1 hypothetical protein M514_11732 [Trichuris suis]